MHKKEIRKLYSEVKREGYSLIPLSVYFKNSHVKVEIGLCKGKKLYDKRQSEAKLPAASETINFINTATVTNEKSEKIMIFLGIDPGVATVGWGIVDYKGNKFRGSDYGAIITPAKTPLPDRLEQIFDETLRIIEYYRVETAAIEKLFFNTNTKTAIDVSQARGVLMLALTKKRLPIAEYTPLQVKQAVTGYGRAEKSQIEAMVKMLLNLDRPPKPDDAADALAIAICCAHCTRF